MKFKGLIRKKKKQYVAPTESKKGQGIPEGMYVQCPKCKGNIYKTDLKTHDRICPFCGYYYSLPAKARLKMMVEDFVEWDATLSSVNPLNFPGYEEKLQKYETAAKQPEAVVTGVGKIDGSEAVFAVMDARFMMGSMGSAVGEKITRAIEKATLKRLPLIIFTASGGARMQEGIFSLMQMAKTSAALARHDDAGLLFISVLTDPTTGGVTASFAMLADIILAEPGALIGFAGPRVIEQTLHQKLPEGFQTAECLLAHGQIDAIVEREALRATLSRLLKLHEGRKENGACDR